MCASPCQFFALFTISQNNTDNVQSQLFQMRVKLLLVVLHICCTCVKHGKAVLGTVYTYMLLHYEQVKF